MLQYIAIIFLAYCIGSISFGVIFSKRFAGFDVRTTGSHGAGATNVLRSVGKKAAALTFLCDLLKGTAALAVAMFGALIWKDLDLVLLKYLAGLFVILGHTFPVFFGFRGGKGVASGLGVLLMLNWKIGMLCFAAALALTLLTKMVSVGSITAAALFPILIVFLAKETKTEAIILSIVIALLIIFNHRPNIKRILTGKENKLKFKKSNK
ncbi:MAG: glycerol-3-phosphate 1-O-acyltransferase PlsY [Oscillospiraceae bacterium]|jgi:glycerol-3-phosphate acyltransferase PlsY|nr:glycerol-3-phosphate 1-O-acyltransferase PlsY [Oscillospiraceae bacterium]